MTAVELNVQARMESLHESAELGGTLAAYLQGLLDAGIEHDQLEASVGRVAASLRAAGKDEAAEIALLCLDLLSGWCAPALGVAPSAAA